jgi:hypothetical protein
LRPTDSKREGRNSNNNNAIILIIILCIFTNSPATGGNYIKGKGKVPVLNYAIKAYGGVDA